MIHARKDYNRFQDPALDDPSLLSVGSTPIGKDEPVMLFRAQDRHAATVVSFYAGLLEADLLVDPMMSSKVKQHSLKMAAWPSRKTPDMPHD